MSFNSTIFKLSCKDINIPDCYVGYTSNFNKIKSYYNEFSTDINCDDYNLIRFKTIRENGGINNWIFEKLEEYNFTTQQDSNNRKRKWILKFKPSLNKKIKNNSLDNITLLENRIILLETEIENLEVYRGNKIQYEQFLELMEELTSAEHTIQLLQNENNLLKNIINNKSIINRFKKLF